MFMVTEQGIWNCAAEAKRQYGDRAESIVARQVAWSEERGAEQEVRFWRAVVERLSAMIARTPPGSLDDHFRNIAM